jgi:hypothetical protein
MSNTARRKDARAGLPDAHGVGAQKLQKFAMVAKAVGTALDWLLTRRNRIAI